MSAAQPLLLYMTSLQATMRVVDDLFERFPDMIEMVRAEFLGTTPDRIACPPQVPALEGGAADDPDDVSDLAFEIYRVMEAADSLHDTEHRHSDLIKESLGLGPDAFPRIIDSKGRKFNTDDLASWRRFHDIITRTPTLQFGKGDPVRNPLCGRGFMSLAQFDYADASTVEDEFDRFRTSGALQCWCFYDAGAQMMELAQIARVCRAIKKQFGDDPVRGNDMTFLPDSEDVLTSIVMGVSHCYKALLFKFDDADVSPTTRLRDRMQATAFTTSDPGKDGTAQILRDSRDACWTCMSCDASMMDAMEHEHEVHPAETGAYKCSAVRVTLHGGSAVTPPEHEYSFTIASDVSIVDDADPAQTSVTRSVRSRHVVIGRNGEPWTEWTSGVVELDHSVRQMRRELDRIRRLPDGTPARAKNCATALALKRSGDWGMVQHCKLNGMIFVTADRFAALYAAYRGVCTLFVKIADVRVPKLLPDMKKNDPRQPPARAEFRQYEFSMFCTDRGKTALKHYGGPPPPVFSGGGDVDRHACALIALTICMALVPR